MILLAENPLLEEIKEEALKCERCDLKNSRRSVVFGEGNPDTDLMFVGEGPGANEDLEGRPFVGKAGQLLTKVLKAVGLEREEVYITNVVKCRPPQNRTPSFLEISLCKPYLDAQIAIIKPKIIVCLGVAAMNALINSRLPISKMRGKWIEKDAILYLATYHPAALLRDPSKNKFFIEDLRNIKEHYQLLKER